MTASPEAMPLLRCAPTMVLGAEFGAEAVSGGDTQPRCDEERSVGVRRRAD